MPKFHAKTISGQQVWQSADGNRTIYEVTLDVDGATAQAKTYSPSIAKVGFSGELESYEKTNTKGGNDTFVKQVPKEGAFPAGGGRFGGKTPADPFTMYLSYAKDILVALLETSGYDEDKYTELLQAAVHGGYVLYDGRPEAPGSKPAAPAETPGDEPINMKSLSDLFPE